MLKKYNYYCENTGEIMPVAYAVVQVNTITNTATFYIASSREKALEKKAVEVVKINCGFNRTENPLVTAYIFAKGQDKELIFNEETKKYEEVVTNRHFFDWQDEYI